MIRPVCAKCGKEMKCDKNGHEVRQVSSHGNTVLKWQGDKYSCTICHASIVTGFGRQTEAPIRDEREFVDDNTTYLIHRS